MFLAETHFGQQPARPALKLAGEQTKQRAGQRNARQRAAEDVLHHRQPRHEMELLMNHRDVFEVVVCGMERDAGKNEIVALISARRDVDINELYKFCRRQAPEYLVPDKILIMDQFAKTETGKIDRPRVIKEAHAKHDR